MNFMPASPAASEVTRLRATCDACKDAKVRCNRGTPTCYRCRNQKLNCVYNLSRRMGRPRRNRSNAESRGVGAEDEQDKAQRPTHGENVGRQDKTASADTTTLRGDPCGEQAQESGIRPSIINSIDHNGHGTGINSDISSMSSLMDPFGNPDDYDLSQLQTPIGMSDFELMADFDIFNGPGPSILSGSAIPNPSQSSQGMRPQATSTLDRVTIPEQTNTSRPVTTSVSDPSPDTLTDGNMMLVDGLEGRPFSSLEGTFGLEQTHVRGTRGQRTPRVLGKHGENGAAPSEFATCDCYQVSLQKLLDIDENQSDILSSTIDVALLLEQCVRGHIAKVLECGICPIKRPTILLLLAVIIDNVVCMFESSWRFGNSRSLVTDNNCNPLFNTPIPPTAPTAFPTPPVADMTGARKGAASPATRTAGGQQVLLVGSYEILSEEKNLFLKLLLQGRLSSLSATLRQLMPYMQRSSPQNSNSRHGTMMMAETYKRLRSVIGRVELWDG